MRGVTSIGRWEYEHQILPELKERIVIFLEGEGPAFAAISDRNWSATPLGTPLQWPTALRSSLQAILRSEAPRALLWGADLLAFCNNACIEQGCVAAAGIGHSYPAFAPERWALLADSVAAALAGHGSVVPEFQAPGANASGDITYQLGISPIFDEELCVRGVLVDIVDLTARQRREDDLRSEVGLLNQLFSTAPVLISHCSGPELTIDYMNPAFLRLFRGRRLIGRAIADALPEAAELGYVERIAEVYETGIPWDERELPLPIRTRGDRKGRIHYFDFACHPIRADGGTISGLLFSGYDVTERRTARDESDRLRHQLLHASRMEAMGTMAATIAHELNQPLAAATNYLAAVECALGPQGSEGDDPDLLVEARMQLLRAGTIIRRMRSLVECGAADALPFDLLRSLERAIDLLRAGGELVGFTIEIEPTPERLIAKGDDIQIEQVFVNILRNAAFASTNSPSRKVRICARRHASIIEVLIRDWGPGIPPSILDRLFSTMQQPSCGGLGVGLSLCRTIIEAHGGTIEAWNQGDRGAIFRFTLPAADSPRAS